MDKNSAQELYDKSVPQGIDATFVEDMAERWIVIECLDAIEKRRIMEAIRRVLGGEGQ